MADISNSDEHEEWRDIPDWPEYQASSLGRVKHLAYCTRSRHGAKVFRGEHIPCPKPSRTTGYFEIAVRRNGKIALRTTFHSLVCRAFHGPPPSDRHQVAHGDGCRTNNRPENLRWATAKENGEDRGRHGTDHRGAEHWKTRLTGEQVLAIRADYRGGYGDLERIAKDYAVTRGAIWRIVHRRNWKHI